MRLSIGSLLFLGGFKSGLAAGNNKLKFNKLRGSDGLCSPRKIEVYNGMLYIAESGVGPDPFPSDPANTESCFFSPIFNSFNCVGSTSLVSKLPTKGGVRKEVIGDLFSQRASSGSGETEATGAQSVCFDHDGKIYVVVGLGLNGTLLESLGIDEEFGEFGSVLKSNAGRVVAAPWESEYENNYDGSMDPAGVLPVPNSNPYHISCSRGRYYVVDAGCNCIMKYSNLRNKPADEPQSVLVLPKYTNIPAIPNDQPGPCFGVSPPMGPPFCGQFKDGQGNWLYDAEAVPTATRIRPGVHNKLYVSTLRGALWNTRRAQVLEVGLDKHGNFIESTLVEVAGGFWAIADFDFYGNDLYVLEVNPGSPFIPFSGRLTRVNVKTGKRKVVAQKELNSPTGILVDGNKLYITNNTDSGSLDTCDGHVIVASLAKKSNNAHPNKRSRATHV